MIEREPPDKRLCQDYSPGSLDGSLQDGVREDNHTARDTSIPRKAPREGIYQIPYKLIAETKGDALDRNRFDSKDPVFVMTDLRAEMEPIREWRQKKS